MTLVFYVRGQALSEFVPDTMVSDTINYQDAEIRFSEDWDGLDKWMHLKAPDGAEYEARIVDDRVSGLNLSAGRWEVWFHGSGADDAGEAIRITTDTTAFVVEQSGALDGDPLPPIELSAAEQIAAAVTRTEGEVADLREDVEQYRAEVSETAAEVQAAKVAAEAAAVGAFGSQAAADQSAQSAQIAAQNAEKAKQAIEDMSVRAVTLDPGADTTVTKDKVGDSVRLTFGIARGGVGPEGPTGPAGVSVSHIERVSGTGAPGTYDTYAVYLSDGSTAGQFSVYNPADGEDGEDGRDGTGTGDFMADGSVPMTGALQMGGNRVTGVGAPTEDGDAVRKSDLTAHTGNTNNPHAVTAAQVGAAPAGYGLGEGARHCDDCNTAVVSGWYVTGGSTVNYPEDATQYGWMVVSSRSGTGGMIRQDYFTGTSTPTHYVRYCVTGTWGEWKTALTELGAAPVSHVSDTANPHAVTAAQVGAAPTSHNHSAGNITSGTLPVARGGTGVTSNPSMLANLGSTAAASVFAASPRPGVTGTLPVANGGTGVTSMAGASGLAHALFPTTITSYSGYSFPLLGNSWNNNGYINIGNMCAAIGAATTTTYTATVSTGWTASGNYYHKDVSVPGLLATDDPIADVVLGGDAAADELYKNAWALIDRIETANNWITVYSVGAAPAVAFTVRLKVVR